VRTLRIQGEIIAMAENSPARSRNAAARGPADPRKKSCRRRRWWAADACYMATSPHHARSVRSTRRTAKTPPNHRDGSSEPNS